MPFADLISSGAWLMLYGMGIVFSLLTLLVFAVRASSKAAQWLQQGASSEGSSAPEAAASTGDPMLVAAIGAAIARYRANHR